MPDEPTAAVRYKEIMGLARRAADELREWERRRAAELESRIAEAQARLDALAEQETAAQERAHRWWRMACDNVDRLPWLEPGQQPAVVTSARGEWADRYAEDIRITYRELTNAINDLGWRARR
ncbi:hypothetical protein [Saccharomonospora piscinae]|uniref:Uncharacterized protein n=1 Tax=Saccharomonospora piscinae TaxID=687388 RepID=A0A1V9A7N7_SACPI|nr:hypothetical protein [Saccharomonospora piscinae]OQO92944.1 hypothetical protein B1813_12565 [Saccharomonospora piscinae]TLW93080.1 hypothetical protein FFT09_06515 [Saccharomonospora piscinae]